MEIFSIQELEKVIRHVEIEGQGGIFQEETGKQPKDHPKEFLDRIVNYITDNQLIKKIQKLTDDEALHLFVKSVYVVCIKDLHSSDDIEEEALVQKVFSDYLKETSMAQ
jgi:hypothetical protein